MKQLIATAVIGKDHEKIAALTLPSIALYAERMGADFRIITELLPEHSQRPIFFVKFWIGKLLEDYDEVLWLDCDAIVSRNAPSIFEKAKGCFAAYPESEVVPERLAMFKDYWVIIKGHPMPQPEADKYFNSGITVIPKTARSIFANPNLLEVDLTIKACKINSRFFWDQSYCNMKIFEGATTTVWLAENWNMIHISPNWAKRTEIAHIIHYAGHRKEDPETIRIIKQDLTCWGF